MPRLCGTVACRLAGTLICDERSDAVSDSDVFLADCPARTTLALVADTWSVVVIFGLGDGPRRYSELRDRIGGISKKMLTQTLRKLEASGLIERRVLATAPPGVEYLLTPLGNSLQEPVSMLARWAEDHAEELAHGQDC
jgi:DNA-binding HxlR family transcriptional regulator